MARFSAWPIVAHAPGDLPEPLGPELLRQLAPDERLEQLVYIPADPTAPARGRWVRTRGMQALALTDRRILIGVQILTNPAERWFACPYPDLSAWELQQNLLYGRLDLSGAQHGRIDHARLEFNTVGMEQVEHALAPMERAVLGVAHTDAPPAERTLDAAHLPFHFAAYLRHELLPGETVQAQLIQPLILEPYLRIFKRIVATPALVVATDRRLLVIREAPLTLKPRYGQRRFSLPVRRTADLALREADDRLVLTYAPDPVILELPLDREQRPAIAQLLDRLGAAQHVYA